MIDSLFRKEYRPLCIYALHYLGDTSDSEDVVSDAFGKLWDRISSEGSPANPRAWLYTCVRNACIDLLRARGHETLLPRDLEGSISDEEAIDRSAIEARLWTAIERMPEKRRQIFLMAKRDGMSYDEIAAELGISANTVRNHVENAFTSLRESRKEILNFVFFF
ncbi:MAG: RNA polymerase sigma-70 factor [Bacteroidales bacterium]|nr:RNA polymerase sigma-70 factor [Bacteroidales bacterium]